MERPNNMENDILRQNQFFNSDPKKQYEMVNEHFSNLRTQLRYHRNCKKKDEHKITINSLFLLAVYI